MTSKRKRGERRVIDKVLNDGVEQQSFLELERHWSSISDKAIAMQVRRMKLSMGMPIDPPLPDNPFTEDEQLALFQVAQQLFDRLETDSHRRDHRDLRIAEDFLLHSEILGEKHVAKRVCARWNVGISTVKSAVADYRHVLDQLRHQIEHWDEVCALSESDGFPPAIRAKIVEAGSAAAFMKNRIVKTAEKYRMGNDGFPAPRPGRKKGR